MAPPTVEAWQALATLLQHHNYKLRPQDAGGATNMGITVATLARWRGRAVSVDDVR